MVPALAATRRLKAMRIPHIMVILFTAHLAVFAGQDHWVITWGCGAQLTEPGNLPPAPMAHSTLRQFVHVTIGGKQLRVRLSNSYGTDSVTMETVHLALAAGSGSAGDGDINQATDKMITFDGAAGITVPAGGEVSSDPCEYSLPALTNLAITIYFGEAPTNAITGHPGSRTSSFIQSGNQTAAANLVSATKVPHWYFITGVEVLADSSSKALVVLGDSITDGRGSTTDGNNRWPDDLAERLNANPATAGVAVENMGIGGNGIFGGLGPAGMVRFDRDVINQSGVRWVVILEGVNDIGGDFKGTVATNLIAAYTQFTAKAHARNLLVYGATITPFGGNRYFTVSHEASRQAVNAWIRTNHLYDGVIDFDATVRDPENLTNLRAAFNTGDGLHLNPAGYRAMAAAIAPALFTK